MNPICFLLLHESRETVLNYLLIRPLWHECDFCTRTSADVHVYMDTLQRACKCSHTSIYTSNLLVMRSLLSLEPREGGRDWKRDEGGMRGGVETKQLKLFHWRSGYKALIDWGLKRQVCVCALANRVQNRCDQQVFSPQELAVSAPGVVVRVEPAGVQRHRLVTTLHYFTS